MAVTRFSPASSLHSASLSFKDGCDPDAGTRLLSAGVFVQIKGTSWTG